MAFTAAGKEEQIIDQKYGKSILSAESDSGEAFELDDITTSHFIFYHLYYKT